MPPGLIVDRPRGSGHGTNAAVAVGTTAVPLVAENGSRVAVKVQPIGGDIFVGFSDAVTVDDGIKVVDGEVLEELDFLGELFAVAATGSIDVRVAEVG